jgi:hypothetical protein
METMTKIEKLQIFEEMLIDHIRSDSFGDLTTEGRNKVINFYEEVRMLVNDD